MKHILIYGGPRKTVASGADVAPRNAAMLVQSEARKRKRCLRSRLFEVPYGDSLSWGIIPGTRKRLNFDSRWPGVLEAACNARNARARVQENCLNGRRTAWQDPMKDGRDGSQGLARANDANFCLPRYRQSHSPISHPTCHNSLT